MLGLNAMYLYKSPMDVAVLQTHSLVFCWVICRVCVQDLVHRVFMQPSKVDAKRQETIVLVFDSETHTHTTSLTTPECLHPSPLPSFTYTRSILSQSTHASLAHTLLPLL